MISSTSLNILTISLSNILTILLSFNILTLLKRIRLSKTIYRRFWCLSPYLVMPKVISLIHLNNRIILSLDLCWKSPTGGWGKVKDRLSHGGRVWLANPYLHGNTPLFMVQEAATCGLDFGSTCVRDIQQRSYLHSKENKCNVQNLSTFVNKKK